MGEAVSLSSLSNPQAEFDFFTSPQFVESFTVCFLPKEFQETKGKNLTYDLLVHDFFTLEKSVPLLEWHVRNDECAPVWLCEEMIEIWKRKRMGRHSRPKERQRQLVNDLGCFIAMNILVYDLRMTQMAAVKKTASAMNLSPEAVYGKFTRMKKRLRDGEVWSARPAPSNRVPIEILKAFIRMSPEHKAQCPSMFRMDKRYPR